MLEKSHAESSSIELQNHNAENIMYRSYNIQTFDLYISKLNIWSPPTFKNEKRRETRSQEPLGTMIKYEKGEKIDA